MNRLAGETSPYLRQHADNPVDWYPWGEEAFARARRGQADPPVGRVLVVSLVPRDGARVVRGPRHRRDHERAVRQREGRPRGAPRRRRDLHASGAGDDRQRRLADDRVPRARRSAVLRRHLLPAPTTVPGCPASCESWTRSTKRGAAAAPSCSRAPSNSTTRSRRARESRAVTGRPEPTVRPRSSPPRFATCVRSSTLASAASGPRRSSRRR